MRRLPVNLDVALLAFAPDGTTLAVGETSDWSATKPDGAALWNVRDGQQVARWNAPLCRG